MTNSSSAKPILVLGGTGKTGRRIAQQLIEQGHCVRIGSRSGEPAFDWQTPDGWAKALHGVRAVYVSYHPDLAIAGAVEAVRALTELARAEGVRRLVLLSGRGEAEAQRAEEAIKQPGMDWTILRASWFAQNFSESFLLDAVRGGVVALPVGEVGEPFIDVQDIADAAVAALTRDGHGGKLYELTGPRLLSFADAVEEIARASGRPVRFERMPASDYAQALEHLGLPAEMVELILYLFTSVLDGRNARLGNGVQQALGRDPADFTDYAQAVAATGLWGTKP